MATVAKAVAEVQRFPQELILLGVRPDEAEEGYGWIEPGAAEVNRESWPVRRFWEKPARACAQQLLCDGALWNTFVFVVHVPALWAMVREVAPDLCHTFNTIRLMLNSAYAPLFTAHAYETMRTLDFSAGICEPLINRLRVLAVPEVGWSDWGSAERICESLHRIGKLNECLARFRRRNGEDALPQFLAPFLPRPSLQTGFSPARAQVRKGVEVQRNLPAVYLKE